MKYFLDLFAGIGGFALGAYWAGLRFDGHYFSEVDDYAIKIYQRRFQGAIELGDIRAIQKDSLPKGDWIFAGGFPCQDISVAGKGAGLEGQRSGLWFEYARLIDEVRPCYAVIENVGAITFRGLDQVLSSLAEIGYDAEWQDIRASDVGAPHRRERLWIVAYPNTNSESRYAKQEQQYKRAAQFDAGSNNRMEAWDDVADSNESWKLQPKRVKQEQREWIRYYGEAVPHPYSGNNYRKQWEVEPALGCMVDGLPAGMDRFEGRLAHESYQRVKQLKCLGNSIVPQIAALIFSAPAFDGWRFDEACEKEAGK